MKNTFTAFSKFMFFFIYTKTFTLEFLYININQGKHESIKCKVTLDQFCQMH